ncbi:uncharacterized protein ACA1_020660 [Acanthamoeba castellanii str. Neff]|uniref:Uncharacterized protein n=1 Tax=Acanthamoeba castellanii (strain ATCC 30010 / Neff) TaxID=1257118 RepID=L8GPZ9_ACACF|nr:uncharacterized protein ACA1_020660 [Acanthamoeba castellanii str. Neff]ELR14191.1 hypothetical protein ACA1_020660 [Acanthamoeba castellanii str. Neff]
MSDRTLAEIVDRAQVAEAPISRQQAKRCRRTLDCVAIRRILATSEAEAAFKAHFDSVVAAYVYGTCREVQRRTGLALPRFTSMDDVTFFVLPDFGRNHGVWTVVANIESPRLEALLESAGI